MYIHLSVCLMYVCVCVTSLNTWNEVQYLQLIYSTWSVICILYYMTHSNWHAHFPKPLVCTTHYISMTFMYIILSSTVYKNASSSLSYGCSNTQIIIHFYITDLIHSVAGVVRMCVRVCFRIPLALISKCFYSSESHHCCSPLKNRLMQIFCPLISHTSVHCLFLTTLNHNRIQLLLQQKFKQLFKVLSVTP